MKKHDSSCEDIVVALDRMEIGKNERASLEMKNLGLKVYSIITLDDIEQYLANNQSLSHHLNSMKEYTNTYKR